MNSQERNPHCFENCLALWRIISFKKPFLVVFSIQICFDFCNETSCTEPKYYEKVKNVLLRIKLLSFCFIYNYVNKDDITHQCHNLFATCKIFLRKAKRTVT